SYSPPRTVHCVVVDPGVGSKRRAVAIRTNRGLLVGPDNGVFSLVTTAEGVNVLEAVTLTNPEYQLPAVSATFHGRDIFAPAAAYIAGGVALSRFGPSAINLVRLAYAAKSPAGRPAESRIIYIDRFGNLILDITAHNIEDNERVTFEIGGHIIKSLSYTFADVPEHHLLAYVGSTRDHIEIAIRNGNAAQTLGVQVGAVVKVNRGQ
ncbi:MAG: SAM-dependent chlorinase/fluorinase, partial [Chloroflexota bacterium]